jgi:hypothetical protein
MRPRAASQTPARDTSRDVSRTVREYVGNRRHTIGGSLPGRVSPELCRFIGAYG